MCSLLYECVVTLTAEVRESLSKYSVTRITFGRRPVWGGLTLYTLFSLGHFQFLTLDKGIRKLRSNDKMALVRSTMKVTKAAFSKSVSCT